MASTPVINYNNKSFIKARQELINYVKQNYPDDYQDFNDSSIGTLLIELIAVSTDILSYSNDRNFTETQIDYAQQRASIFQLAKNLGVAIPNNRASVTVIDITVTLPVLGSEPDFSYAPIFQADTSFNGGGKVFTLSQAVDFNEPLSSFGLPNRTIIPVVDANQSIRNYKITKREVVFNGLIKTFTKNITQSDNKPFLQIVLPDTDIVNIEQVILLSGFNNSPTINDFFNPDNTYYEVDYLLQDRIFTTDNTFPTENGIKAAKWFKVFNKFIKEFTPNGYCKLTFGGGNADANVFQQALESINVYQGFDNYLENTSLGTIPPVNSQIIIRYRTGGGISSNIGSNTINQIGSLNVTINGSDLKVVEQVRRSVTVNNPIPALGGANSPSTEQIRNIISYNYASQDRAVILNDYSVILTKMPGIYGSPFRYNVSLQDNKIVYYILGIDENSKLNNTSNNLLKQNIAEFISQKRMVNDYVEVNDGKIINLGCVFELYIAENIPSNTIALNTINVITDYFNIFNNTMNTDVFLGDLIEKINNVNGVYNIINYTFYNKVGSPYSLNEIDMSYQDNKTREIHLVNNTLYSSENSMFEIKYPEKDIIIRLKKKNQLENPFSVK